MVPLFNKKASLCAMAGVLLAVSAALIGCGQATPEEEPKVSPTATQGAASDVLLEGADGGNSSGTYLLLNQRWVEGLSEDVADLEDVDAMFWHIFSKLPDEVVVYPSENYFYFILYVGTRQLWGNMRLAAGRREQGVLSFAYFEFKESPFVLDPILRRSKFFTDSDGLVIKQLDRFTFVVRYNNKDVTFNLHQLSQEPPKLFRLGPDETYIMRTFDESGYQFFLLFNDRRNYFMWVLNEEELVADQLMLVEEDLWVGRRSGFAFWVDPAHKDRKTLVAIRGQNATVNNYYDGPFDQLADNYVDETNIAEFMVRASPNLEGRIDKFGYFMDRQSGSSRVAISPYFVYFTQRSLKQYLVQLRRSEDPYFLVSRRGVLPTPTPLPPGYPTPFPTAYPTPFPTPFPTSAAQP